MDEMRAISLGKIVKRGEGRPTIMVVDWPAYGGMRVREAGELTAKELMGVKYELNRRMSSAMWREGLLVGRAGGGAKRVGGAF